MRSPSTWHRAPDGPPRNATLYVVSYLDVHGHVISVLYRQGVAAERFAAEAEARGGAVRVDCTPLPSSCWSPARRGGLR